eukprot:1238865-Alexandrium_andersonii.AAC.1
MSAPRTSPGRSARPLLTGGMPARVARAQASHRKRWAAAMSAGCTLRRRKAVAEVAGAAWP